MPNFLHNLRNRFAVALFVVAVVLEEILVTGRANVHRGVGHEAGPWAVRLPLHTSHWAEFLAWFVLVLAAFAFVRFLAEGDLVWVAALIAVTIIFEVLHFHDLPFPQNTWWVALAWAIGVIQTIVEIVRSADIHQRIRDALGFA